jgi:hypothetical protein
MKPRRYERGQEVEVETPDGWVPGTFCVYVSYVGDPVRRCDVWVKAGLLRGVMAGSVRPRGEEARS